VTIDGPLQSFGAQAGEMLPPPPALFSRNPLSWIRFFGPGAILASVNIGSGELVFPARGGAMFGYGLIWIFPLVALLKWGMAYYAIRHMVLSGAHPLERWSRLPGPRGWLSLAICLIVVMCLPLWMSFLQGILGDHCATVVGQWDRSSWATFWTAICFVLLMIGGYNFLEKSQIVILALMLLAVFVSVFWVQPDWLAALRGFFVPQPLAYPDWALRESPKLLERSVWVEVLVYVSVIGGPGDNYLSYASFLRDRRWGRSAMGLANETELQEMAGQPKHPARLWLRAALIDTIASFAAVVVIAVAFTILGVMILQPKQLLPDNADLLTHQAQFLTELAPWLKHVYDFGVFLAFVGIVLGAPDLFYRLLSEFFRTVPRWRGHVNQKWLRLFAICWAQGGGLAVLWLTRNNPEIELLDLATPAGIFAGVLGTGLFCLINPWMDWRFLPSALRAPWYLVALNIGAGLILLGAGVKSLWDYGKSPFPRSLGESLAIPEPLFGFVVVAAVLAVAWLAAWAMRKAYSDSV